MNLSGASTSVQQARRVLPESLHHPTVLTLLRLSIAEDVDPEGEWTPEAYPPFRDDVTSTATLRSDSLLKGHLVAKEAGVVAGLPLAQALCQLVDDRIEWTNEVAEGDRVEAGQPLATIAGPGPALLTAERPALNMVGRLSGIASLTRRFVDAVSHTTASILDTRKTLPGSRRPNKYAVRQGGGQNHRLGLFDMVLIKDNHIDGAGSISNAVRRVRDRYGDQYPIEVEVKTLDELDEALTLTPEFILLDNMEPPTLRQAVSRAEGGVLLEASGNVTLDTVSTVAETGVDRISVGALTHSASSLDMSIRVE